MLNSNNESLLQQKSFEETQEYLSFCKGNNKLLIGVKSAVIVISDRASKGIYKDKSGILIKDVLMNAGSIIQDYSIISDDTNKISDQISQTLNTYSSNLIITTGGTGLCKRDNTPKVIESMCDRIIPGIGEALRAEGAKFTKHAWISGCIGGVINRTLIISLPGAPNAVKQSMNILMEIIPYALYELEN